MGGLTDVGTYSSGASPYKVLDMGGNVIEWVNDWYSKDYYAKSAARNPRGPEQKDTGISKFFKKYAIWRKNTKVLRGGSWVSGEDDLKVTTRFYYSPSYKFDDIGFRCAKSTAK